MVVKHPKITRKLPELFEEIIKNDTFLDELQQSNPVILAAYRKAKENKFALVKAAENYVKRSKKSS